MKVIEADSSFVAYLSNFGKESFVDAYECTLPLEELDQYVNVAFSESTIREEIMGALATYFVCLDSSSNPCGYAKVIQSPVPVCVGSDSSIELQRLYVDSNFRGRGIGKRLETHIRSYARNRHISTIWLRVWEGNTAAQDIYKYWGYSVVGKEPYEVGKERRTVQLMKLSLQ